MEAARWAAGENLISRFKSESVQKIAKKKKKVFLFFLPVAIQICLLSNSPNQYCLF